MKQQRVSGIGVWVNGVRLLSHDEVEAKVGISRQTIYNYMRTRGFPRPMKIGRMFGWSEASVDAWLTAELQRSTQPVAATSDDNREPGE